MDNKKLSIKTTSNGSRNLVSENNAEKIGHAEVVFQETGANHKLNKEITFVICELVTYRVSVF